MPCTWVEPRTLANRETTSTPAQTSHERAQLVWPLPDPNRGFGSRRVKETGLAVNRSTAGSIPAAATTWIVTMQLRRTVPLRNASPANGITLAYHRERPGGGWLALLQAAVSMTNYHANRQRADKASPSRRVTGSVTRQRTTFLSGVVEGKTARHNPRLLRFESGTHLGTHTSKAQLPWGRVHPTGGAQHGAAEPNAYGLPPQYKKVTLWQEPNASAPSLDAHKPQPNAIALSMSESMSAQEETATNEDTEAHTKPNAHNGSNASQSSDKSNAQPAQHKSNPANHSTSDTPTTGNATSAHNASPATAQTEDAEDAQDKQCDQLSTCGKLARQPTQPPPGGT